jgi:hypothetical protein
MCYKGTDWHRETNGSAFATLRCESAEIRTANFNDSLRALLCYYSPSWYVYVVRFYLYIMHKMGPPLYPVLPEPDEYGPHLHTLFLNHPFS